MGRGCEKSPGCFNISTGNIQSINEGGKFHNIIREMSRLNIQIMRIRETWWPTTAQFNNNEVYYSLTMTSSTGITEEA